MDSTYGQGLPWSAVEQVDHDSLLRDDMDFTSLVDLDGITLDNFLSDEAYRQLSTMPQNHFPQPSYMASTGDPVDHIQMQLNDPNVDYYPAEAPPTPLSYNLGGSDRVYRTYDHQNLSFQQNENMQQPHQQAQTHVWADQPADFTPLLSPAVVSSDVHLPSTGPALRNALPSPLTSPTMPDQCKQMPESSRPRSTPTQGPSLVDQHVARPQKRKSATPALAPALGEVTQSGPPPRAHYPPEPRAVNCKMGPPPKPGKDYRSPRIVAQIEPASTPTPSTPATPMSLMSLTSTQSQSTNGNRESQSVPTKALSSIDSSLHDLALPPAARAAQFGAPARVTTETYTAAEDDTQSGQRKTPKLSPLDTASSNSSRNASATSSPQVTGKSGGVPRPGKPSNVAAQARKRGGSAAPPCRSPAILPRISPSIKPLLPSAGSGPESDKAIASAHSSKSNYQNLLQGTLLPGVSYPESLTSGLTSKRTSHKIAEQDRRTRINDALRQLQGLLPASPVASPAVKSKAGESNVSRRPSLAKEDASTAAGSGSASPIDSSCCPAGSADREGQKGPSNEARIANSKAATVENAIDYILELQKEIEGLKNQVRERTEEIRSLKA